MSSSQYILFLDLETTGLEEKEGFIIELGMAIYTTDLELVDMYQSICAHEESARFLKDNSRWNDSEFAYRMHRKNGLNDELFALRTDEYELPDGEFNTKNVFERALDFAGQYVPVDGTEPLAGNSLHFDRAWLKHHVPWFNDKFHYRNIDASSQLEWLKKRNPAKAQEVEKMREALFEGEHRVGADIRDSANLFRSLYKVGAAL